VRLFVGLLNSRLCAFRKRLWFGLRRRAGEGESFLFIFSAAF